VRALLALLVAFAALGGGYLVWRRTRRLGPVSRRLSAYCAFVGALAALVTLYSEHIVLGWAGLDFDVRTAGAAGALMATFLLAAPLEEAAKVLVVWPLYRTRRIDSARLGLCYAALSGAGFAAAEALWRVLSSEAVGPSAGRALLGSVAHLFFAGAWGYALGAGRGRGQARWFATTWCAAVVLHGLFTHIVWGRGPGYLAATLPLLGFMALGAWYALRELAPDPHAGSAVLDPPTMGEVREALRSNERPVMVWWVVAGAFVTLGLVLTMAGASVLLGRSMGIDFAVADEADVRSAGPLLLLGSGVLLAFPFAGYLVARASAAPTLLEPMLATLIALAALVGLLAFTAPIAVLFVLAVAPVAVGFACGGAWIGLEH
jgi:RsiW-degrading membrane proteinase PrsW (M82 family)